VVFNSLHFGVFFVAVFVLFWTLAPYRRVRTVLLLIASYYFYMTWDWRFAGLIAGSTMLDYCVGRGLARTERKGRRTLLLVLSLVGNLGALATFKYFDFFLNNFYEAFGWFEVVLRRGDLKFLLPVGISFYTFQTLSYTIDVYRRKLEPTRNLLDFAVFVAFFPQLVAGPIVRAADFLPQLGRKMTFDDDRAVSGLTQIFRGLFKKVVIADLLAVAIVDRVYQSPADYSGLMNLLATYAYALQIYCDFSGYSDVAIGAGRMLGFRLPVNFNRPYLAVTARDFWARWHISLSTWLRDYLYIPLGGNRKGRFATYRNLAITMLLGGLWHGAAWGFVGWGAFHGTWLMVNRAFGTRKTAEQMSFLERLARRLATFHLVCFGWILFRADSLDKILAVLGQIFSFAGGPMTAGYLVWVPLAIGFGVHFTRPEWLAKWLDRFQRAPALVQGAVYAGLLVLFVGMSGAQVPFIYFQF